MLVTPAPGGLKCIHMTQKSVVSADTTEGSTIRPAARSPVRPAVVGGNLHDVYHRLRDAILDGTLAGGEIINQVQLSRRFGVSRTPVREALRMLQAEGLVESQYQQRMRVTAVTPEEVDAVYATWILVDSLSTALTVPRITDDDFARIETALERMNAAGDPQSKAAWEPLHREFHDLLVMHAGPVLQGYRDLCWDRSERVRRTRASAAAVSWHLSEDEHVAIVRAYKDRSVERAVQGMARHLARMAVAVIGFLEPNYEPRAIRQALNLISRPEYESFAPFLSVVGAGPVTPRRRRAT
jgi:DNA-binding GntR family transcriptional regulator